MTFDDMWVKVMGELDKRGMSEEQKCYAVAKACYDTMYQIDGDIENKVLEENVFISYIPECPTLHGIRAKHSYEFVENKEEFQRYLELFYQECDKRGVPWEWNKTLYGDAFVCLKKAEGELLEWFKNQIETARVKGMADERHSEAIANMMNDWMCRKQLIDIAMKWKPLKMEQQED